MLNECFNHHIPLILDFLNQYVWGVGPCRTAITIFNKSHWDSDAAVWILVGLFLLAANASSMVSELGLMIMWSPREDPRISWTQRMTEESEVKGQESPWAGMCGAHRAGSRPWRVSGRTQWQCPPAQPPAASPRQGPGWSGFGQLETIDRKVGLDLWGKDMNSNGCVDPALLPPWPFLSSSWGSGACFPEPLKVRP